MEIRVSKNINDYVRKKKLAGLVVNVGISGCCCGAVEYPKAKFVTDEKARDLMDQGYSEQDVDGVKILFPSGMDTEDIVDIRMFNLFGLKSIKVGGIKLSCSTCRPRQIDA